MEVGVFKSTLGSVLLYNAFVIGAMVYLAVIFGKWWIIFFSLLFLEKSTIVRRGDEEVEEDVQDR